MRKADWAALALALSAVAASLWVWNRVYEGVPHLEDEFAFLWEAEVMAEGRIALPTPPEPKSFLVPFVVDHDGLRFGKYPPGWPAELSLGSWAGAPWAVNAILAGLSIWLIYRLGSKVSNEGVGLVAAMLALSSPMFLMLSGSLLSHTFSLFLSAAFSLAWLDLTLPDLRGAAAVPRWMLVVVGGLSLGLLAITRPLTAVGFVLPFAVHGLVILLREKRRLGAVVLALAALAAGLSALLVLWQWTLAGDPFKNLYSLWWAYDKVGFGPGVGVTDSGHSLQLAYWNTRWSLRVGLHDLFGWPYLSWLFLPVGILALRRTRAGWLLLATFPALVLAYLFYWVGSWLYGPRYIFEALPGLAIISALGVAKLGGWLEAEKVWKWRKPLIIALLALLLLANVRFYLPPRLTMMNQLNGMSRQHQAPFEQRDLEGALVFVHLQDSWHEYGTLLTLTPPFSEGDVLIVVSRGQGADARVMEAYPDRPVYHYYADEPGVFYRQPR